MSNVNFLGASGLYGRGNTLIDGPAGVNVTNLKRKFNVKENGAPLGPADRTGPMRSQPVPFAVIANAAPITIAVQDPFRKGLFIQNLDATNNLFVGLGTLADTNQLRLGPGGYILLDFVCPTDAISVFAQFNISGYMLTMAPIAT